MHVLDVMNDLKWFHSAPQTQALLKSFLLLLLVLLCSNGWNIIRCSRFGNECLINNFQFSIHTLIKLFCLINLILWLLAFGYTNIIICHCNDCFICLYYSTTKILCRNFSFFKLSCESEEGISIIQLFLYKRHLSMTNSKYCGVFVEFALNCFYESKLKDERIIKATQKTHINKAEKVHI